MKDEKKTKKQLINELVELRQRITELEALEAERKWAEWALGERVKELTCLYAVNRNMQEGLPIDELCRGVIEHLVPAMQFPEITVPVIELEDSRFAHERYTEKLSYGLHAEIRVGGEARGHLWVYYAEDRPFLIPEEQNLLNAIAEAFGLWLERKKAEEALKEYSQLAEETVAELRDAQEQLIRKERLALLGQLAGGVGHELRNPLGVISNAVYYLQTALPDADETTKEYLEVISSEVRNSAKIVSGLLDLSRTRPAEREEIAVSDLVTQVLERHPPPQKVKVTTKIAPNLPPVFVDPRQIGQVLVNLVTNAYQAMPEGGRLTINAQGEKDQVYLSITDTGCGISKENTKMLFEPLFTTKVRGIGLGLAVSKNLVEVNGESIEVESQEGRGSTFTLILPTKEAQA